MTVLDFFCHPENDPVGNAHEFIMGVEDQFSMMFAPHISPIKFAKFLPLEMNEIIQLSNRIEYRKGIWNTDIKGMIEG
jgi:hypothetical protein